MNDTIFLPIKKEFFDMILAGIKKDEYRALNQRYIKRFTGRDLLGFTVIPGKDYNRFKKKTVTFINGYGWHRPWFVIQLKAIKIKTPNPDWCPPGTEGPWFALELGEVLEKHNINTPQGDKE
ncbi:ASCH domain-containing protein [Lewinella sp. W8]|uniref:ASCH domain-containing protein n=1 Tax=Lewinella sp. W8 TaxID=2528208 RepID=UPI0010688438|nr:ASCH domain-containing protein [Lewinella sp. W8]MTB53026.1 hypothetical protein [Lewinella sp. W8]